MKTVANASEKQESATEVSGRNPHPAEKFTDELNQLRQMAEQQWERTLARATPRSDDDAIHMAELVERIDVCEGRFLAFWRNVVEVMLDQGIERIVALEAVFSELRNAMGAVEEAIPVAVAGDVERAVYLSHLQCLRDTLAGYRDHLSEIIENKFQVETELDDSEPHGRLSRCRVTRKRKRRH